MISMDKKYRTRDGRDVRILCTDAPGHAPVIGYIKDHGKALLGRWTHEGTAYDRMPHCDLIEVRSAEDVVLAKLVAPGRNGVTGNEIAMLACAAPIGRAQA